MVKDAIWTRLRWPHIKVIGVLVDAPYKLLVAIRKSQISVAAAT